jgi:hypothetical protein
MSATFLSESVTSDLSDLPVGSLVLRGHGFFSDGSPMPDCDFLIEAPEGEHPGDIACAELAGNDAQEGRGIVFRIDSDDQSTTLYHVTHAGWSATGA